MSKGYHKVFGFLKTLAYSFPIAVTITDIFGHVAKVEGASMQPSLNPDFPEGILDSDFVFLNRWTTRNYNIQKGSIVAFTSPHNPRQNLIKRVIALENEIIQTPLYKKPVVKVPVGHCWVEGDNKLNSFDSNVFGPFFHQPPHQNPHPPPLPPPVMWGDEGTDPDDDNESLGLATSSGYFKMADSHSNAGFKDGYQNAYNEFYSKAFERNSHLSLALNFTLARYKAYCNGIKRDGPGEKGELAGALLVQLQNLERGLGSEELLSYFNTPGLGELTLTENSNSSLTELTSGYLEKILLNDQSSLQAPACILETLDVLKSCEIFFTQNSLAHSIVPH